MNRTFPALVLKVEYGCLMPHTNTPTGTGLHTEWLYPQSLYDAQAKRRELQMADRFYKRGWSRRLLRITLCTVQKSKDYRKLFIWTSGEDIHTFRQDAFVPVEVRRARVAIIPAEVIREATRAAQS